MYTKILMSKGIEEFLNIMIKEYSDTVLVDFYVEILRFVLIIFFRFFDE